MQRLEKEIAAARAGQVELQRRIDLFERIAASAGVELDEAMRAAPVPSSLLAAARDARRGSFPVRLAVNGGEVIAVIGGDGGDPHEWWSAIRQLDTRHRSAS
jgi:class 3 adenylate cyclase